jgi:hypothetical protein
MKKFTGALLALGLFATLTACNSPQGTYRPAPGGSQPVYTGPSSGGPAYPSPTPPPPPAPKMACGGGKCG